MFRHLPAKIIVTRISSLYSRSVYFTIRPTRLSYKICGWNSKKSLVTSRSRSSDYAVSGIKENDGFQVEEEIIESELRVEPPKKRGRKPKIREEKEPEPPKKRGRKPKIREKEEPEPPKKRGRKPKITEEEELEPPKKRGRKPKITEGEENFAKRKIKKAEILESKCQPDNVEVVKTKKRKSSKKDKNNNELESGSLSNIKYPLSKDDYNKYLQNIHSRKKEWKEEILENRKYDVKNRVNIIDSKLCDETIERLAPSLEKHKGCDIIDLNPGVGLWSSKLHEFLQPRTHILMEPHPQTFMPILKPLLEAPDSKYRLVAENGMNWAHLENTLTPEFLPHQEVLEAGDPRHNQLNNTLLVIANIGTFQPRRYLGFFSLGGVVIYQFLTAIRTRALFYKFGKVRVLLWMNLSDAKVLPKSVGLRRKVSVEAMASCEHIESVVESDDVNYINREKRLDIERVRLVEESMTKKGIRIPEGRETSALKAMRSGETGIEIEELSPRCLQNELRDLEERYAKGEFEKEYVAISTSKTAKGKPYYRNTAEYDRMCNLARRNRRRVAKTYQLFELADQFEEIINLYKQSRLAPTTESAKDLAHQAKTKTDEWKEVNSSLSPFDVAELLHLCDNRRIFSQNPPGLFWDRREAEPLLAHPNEFYPNKALSLLDIRPRNVPLFAENSLAHDVFLYIIMQITLVPAQSLKEALDSLAPGALDWLTAECPSLTDPLRDGFPDLDLFSARCTTFEMIMELTEAWLRWPFRPSREELLHRLGSEAFYDDAENTDKLTDVTLSGA
ncbi:hypothetical protein K3495_g8115 [Podosphaera aphanis]|nr:hypothetical protein K3495_g8115 [Podosphaera aphanis]